MLRSFVIALAAIAVIGGTASAQGAKAFERHGDGGTGKVADDGGSLNGPHRFAGRSAGRRAFVGRVHAEPRFQRYAGTDWVDGFPGRDPGIAYDWSHPCPMWSAYQSAFYCWVRQRRASPW